jgi:hypothetical protein
MTGSSLQHAVHHVIMSMPIVKEEAEAQVVQVQVHHSWEEEDRERDEWVVLVVVVVVNSPAPTDSTHPRHAWESIAAASAEGSANLQAAMAGMASNFYLHDVATNVRHQNSHQIAGI